MMKQWPIRSAGLKKNQSEEGSYSPQSQKSTASVDEDVSSNFQSPYVNFVQSKSNKAQKPIKSKTLITNTIQEASSAYITSPPISPLFDPAFKAENQLFVDSFTEQQILNNSKISLPISNIIYPQTNGNELNKQNTVYLNQNQFYQQVQGQVLRDLREAEGDNFYAKNSNFLQNEGVQQNHFNFDLAPNSQSFQSEKAYQISYIQGKLCMIQEMIQQFREEIYRHMKK